jgi:poly(glycerol-phosphate) alpha-glucosyltransferase
VSAIAGRRIGLLTAWASRANGGVFEAVVAQCDMIRAGRGVPVVIALASPDDADDRARFGDVEVLTATAIGPAGIGFAPGLRGVLERARLDLLHLHGIWTATSLAGAGWAQGGRPYVISPHGMLDPWILARGRWKKRAAMLAYERRSWRRGALFHALIDAEAADIAAATGGAATAVIPNAVAPTGVTRRGGERFVLYLGRIHPKKNVEALVTAWRLLRERGALPFDARLRIAGWGEAADVASLEAAIAAGPGSDVAFLGPVFGDAKAQLLADARFLALPSHSEGLPMAILEAWASETPTLMSRHCHLDEGFERRVAIDCGTSVEDIASALRTAMLMDEAAWAAMSAKAAALAGEAFAPAVVAGRWADTYGALIERAGA